MGGEREGERETERHTHRHTRNVLQISNFYTQNEYTLKCASKKAVAINYNIPTIEAYFREAHQNNIGEFVS